MRMTDREASVLPMLFVNELKSWEQPELTALNTLPPHTLAVPFPTADNAGDDPTCSPWFRSLNGTWEFKLLPQPEAATAETLAGEDWATIKVPGNWTMQGFGTPHYTNV